MKRKNILVGALAVITAISAGLFVGCNKDKTAGPSKQKQVPVYQGMSIVQGSVVESLNYSQPDFENGHDNGNHNGWYKGDYEGRNDEIVQDAPFDGVVPEHPVGETIEQEIQSSLTVQGAEQTIYYAVQHQDIYINIHINNPDNFEIMSFTLNGKKYASYMFEEGSDMETLVLKYNVGVQTGVVEYTIDAIKYIDGEQIKDVIIDGDKTVRAGVRKDGQVTANVSDVVVNTNDIAFNVNVADSDGLIAYSQGAVKAVLYDGDTLIATKELTLGTNAVTFDNLKTNGLYQYAIVAYYDDLSGAGFGMNVLHKNAVYTQSIVLFDAVTIAQESIAFTLKWNETVVNKTLTGLQLYKGETLVQNLETTATGADRLLSDNEYTLVAEYQNGEAKENIRLQFATAKKTMPSIEVVTENATQTGFGFVVTATDTDSVGAVSKIELLHGEDTPVLATSVEQRAFENLLSDNEYTVRVTYTYDLNDGNGEQTLTCEAGVRTLAKAVPSIEVVTENATQTGFGFVVTATDTDSVGAVSKIELLHGEDTPVLATSVEQRAFENLLSDNEYTIRVAYTYDLNDGNGEQTLTCEAGVRTLAKAMPSVEIKNTAVTQSTIRGAYTVTDTDAVISGCKVELYAGDTLKATNGDDKIYFAELTSYTAYTLKITYTYDLNDGNGAQTLTVEKALKTAPQIEVENCRVLNTSAVIEGETITMHATIDNPASAKVETVVVNGATYSVTSSSTATNLFIEIVHKNQFAGGDTELTIEGLNVRVDSESYYVKTKGDKKANVFINGKLEIVSFDFVNEDLEVVDWAFPSEKLYAMLTFSNPTGYTVDTVVLSDETEYAFGTTLIKVDDEHYYFEPSEYQAFGWRSMYLEEVAYHNATVPSKKIEGSTVYARVYLTTSENAVQITTAEQLLTMQEGKYYELQNDIDLGGREWHGEAFKGVFDANGYAIKNMSYVGTINNTHAYLGLFTEAQGVIKNLHMQNIVYIVELNATEGNQEYFLHCGAIAGAVGEGLILENCSVDKNSVLSLKNKKSASSRVGGLIGGANQYSRFVNCENHGSVSLTETYGNQYVGGIVGDDGVFVDCVNTGAIEGSHYVGGIVGVAENQIVRCVNSGTVSGAIAGGIFGGGRASVSNCSNSGDINGGVYAGGIVAQNDGAVSYCQNSGNVTAKDWANAVAGGIVGSAWAKPVIGCVNTGTATAQEAFNIYAGGIAGEVNSSNGGALEDCYTSVVQNEFDVGCSVEQLNDKTFYIDVLGWSEDVWDFSDLDVENGKYPVLK